jgi:hypothetical protein
MAVIVTDAVITSSMPDIHDLPLDSDVAIDTVEYACIMRRVASQDRASSPPVSAFNSSI